MTSATIIDGKAFAAGLRTRIATQVATFREKAGRAPGLAVQRLCPLQGQGHA